MLGKKEHEGLDDKFGRGGVISEPLPALVVTSVKPFFRPPNSLQLVQEREERVRVAYTI